MSVRLILLKDVLSGSAPTLRRTRIPTNPTRARTRMTNPALGSMSLRLPAAMASKPDTSPMMPPVTPTMLRARARPLWKSASVRETSSAMKDPSSFGTSIDRYLFLAAFFATFLATFFAFLMVTVGILGAFLAVFFAISLAAFFAFLIVVVVIFGAFLAASSAVAV